MQLEEDTNDIKNVFNNKETSVERMSFKKNISWTFIGNLLYAASQWLIIVVMTKVGTVSFVGKYSLALAIITPIFMLTNLQLRAVQVSDAQSDHTFNEYYSLRLLTNGVALVIIFTILFLGRYSTLQTLIIILVALIKLIDAISDILYGLFQKNEHMKIISISLIIKGIVGLLVSSLLLWATGNEVLTIMSIFTVWLLVFLFYDLNKAKKSGVDFSLNFKSVRSLIKVCYPMGILMMLSSLNDSIPRYFIDHYFSSEELGYYSSITYIAITGHLIINAIGQSASPKFARYYSNNEINEFRSLLWKLVTLAVLLGLVSLVIVMLIGKEVLGILYNREYMKYNSLFILIMLNAAISYVGSFLGYAITAARYFKIQPILFFIIVISNLIFSNWLIPRSGLNGVGITLIISSTIQLFGLSLICYHVIRK